jgi:hypothetical protein
MRTTTSHHLNQIHLRTVAEQSRANATEVLKTAFADSDRRTSFLPSGANADANVNMSAAENSVSPSTSSEGHDKDEGKRLADRKRRSTSLSDGRRRRCMRDQHLQSHRRDDGAGSGENKKRRLREKTLMNEAKQQLEAAGETCVRRKMLKIVALALENDKGEFSIFDMSFRRLKSLDERAAALEAAKDSTPAAVTSSAAAAAAAAAAVDETRIQSPAATAAWTTTTTTDPKLIRRGSLNAGGEITEGNARHQTNNNNIGDLSASAAATPAGCAPPEFVYSFHYRLSVSYKHAISTY